MTETPDRYPVASTYLWSDIDPDFDRDPYTPLMRLAEKAEVVSGRNSIFEGVRVPNFNGFPDQDRDVFLTLSYEAWKQVSMNHRAFSNEKAYVDTLQQTMGQILIAMDPPDDTLYKKLILPSFSHRIVNEQLIDYADPIISNCLDEIADQGRGELISSFINRFPYLVVAGMFGVPAELKEEIAELGARAIMLSTSKDADAIRQAFEQMNAFYRKIVDHHHREPREDMTSALMQAEVDGRRLTDDEIASIIKIIVNAGLDTTARQTANLIRLLLENPDQFEDLRANPELLDAAIWESLRLETSAPANPRMTVIDTEVCGVKIPAGSGVYAMIGTANRDPRRWEDPCKFEIRRPKQGIASFGLGIHACLGRSLALAEIKIAMTGVLTRLKNLRKDPDHWDDCYMRGGWPFRSPTILPVLWDPQ